MKKFLILLMFLSLSSLMASDGATLFKKCAVCHGSLAQKKALGKSQVIAKWSAADIATALHGYKDGTYGGTFKGTMKGQVKNLSDEDIKALATYIDGLM